VHSTRAILGAITIDPSTLGTAEVLKAIADLDAKLDALIGRTAPPTKILLTHTEAAQKLGVSRRTFFEWVKGGKIPVVKIGDTTFIRAVALEEFAVANEIPAAKEAV